MEEIIKYLGNFHPVVLHLPIGAFLFTFLLFLSQRFLKSNFDPAIRLGLLFSFITSIITSIFGYILRLFGEYDVTLVDRHMWLALATTLMIGIVMYLHKKQRSFNQILSCFILSTVFLTITGHNGGSLTHGKDYLKLPTIESKISVINYDSIHVFNQVISPILDSKCVKCHNASKSKGSLMLSSVNKIQLGGERGQIIKSSSSINSRLYTYLNLPIDDKMHMPPDGNSQLNENEKELIRMWIDENRIISLQKRSAKSIDDIEKLIVSGQEIEDSGEFLCLLLSHIFKRFESVLAELDDEMDEVELESDQLLVDIITNAGLTKSKGEARRLIKQNAVKLDGAVCKDINQKLHAGKESVIKVGKRRFLKVK